MQFHHFAWSIPLCEIPHLLAAQYYLKVLSHQVIHQRTRHPPHPLDPPPEADFSRHYKVSVKDFLLITAGLLYAVHRKLGILPNNLIQLRIPSVSQFLFPSFCFICQEYVVTHRHRRTFDLFVKLLFLTWLLLGSFHWLPQVMFQFSDIGIIVNHSLISQSRLKHDIHCQTENPSEHEIEGGITCLMGGTVVWKCQGVYHLRPLVLLTGRQSS